jgi:hypothetical protein
MIPIIIGAAKNIFTSFLGQYAEDAKETAMNAARDTVERIITGRQPLEEWAKIAIAGVDEIKDRAVNEEDLRYVGGKLKFAMSEKRADKVVISFELYFQDSNNGWQKIGADSDLFASCFTLEALDEIKSKGEVSFEVEA